jgi:hypothetical protein
MHDFLYWPTWDGDRHHPQYRSRFWLSPVVTGIVGVFLAARPAGETTYGRHAQLFKNYSAAVGLLVPD